MADAGQRDMAAVEPTDLELVRRFVVVAEELNFTRAAVEVAASDAEQPALA